MLGLNTKEDKRIVHELLQETLDGINPLSCDVSKWFMNSDFKVSTLDKFVKKALKGQVMLQEKMEISEGVLEDIYRLNTVEMGNIQKQLIDDVSNVELSELEYNLLRLIYDGNYESEGGISFNAKRVSRNLNTSVYLVKNAFDRLRELHLVYYSIGKRKAKKVFVSDEGIVKQLLEKVSEAGQNLLFDDLEMNEFSDSGAIQDSSLFSIADVEETVLSGIEDLVGESFGYNRSNYTEPEAKPCVYLVDTEHLGDKYALDGLKELKSTDEVHLMISQNSHSLNGFKLLHTVLNSCNARVYTSYYEVSESKSLDYLILSKLAMFLRENREVEIKVVSELRGFAPAIAFLRDNLQLNETDLILVPSL